LIGRGVEVHVDDILIHDETLQQYFSILLQVLDRYREYNVFVKPSKCTLIIRQVAWCDRYEIFYIPGDSNGWGYSLPRKEVPVVLNHLGDLQFNAIPFR
jgi:hypothetical protein